MIKIYDDGLYIIIEVNRVIFDKIDKHLESILDIKTKFLLANSTEISYLSELLNIEQKWLSHGDYFKIILNSEE